MQTIKKHVGVLSIVAAFAIMILICGCLGLWGSRTLTASASAVQESQLADDAKASVAHSTNSNDEISVQAVGTTEFQNAVKTYMSNSLYEAYQTFTDVTSNFLSFAGFRCNVDNKRYVLSELNTNIAVIQQYSSKSAQISGYYIIMENKSVFPDYAGCSVSKVVVSYNGVEKEGELISDFPLAGYARVKVSRDFENVSTFDITYTFPVVELPADPVKEGYTFTGWYIGTQENCNSKCAKYTGTGILENTQLHAHFQINRYTVTFNSDGGSAISPITTDWNTVLSCPMPTRIGYDFIGWRLSDGTTYADQPIKADMTLTAVWQIKTFKVTFYVNGEVYAEQTVEYGSSLVKAMEGAKIASYRAMNMEGERLSKQNTIISEDTQVFVRELTGWEKYGDFVARNHWYTWLAISLLSVLLVIAIVGIVEMVKKR